MLLKPSANKVYEGDLDVWFLHYWQLNLILSNQPPKQKGFAVQTRRTAFCMTCKKRRLIKKFEKDSFNLSIIHHDFTQLTEK